MPHRVSVVVPNYNHARFLRQRLDSIFAQTFQDFEVIILDDASTDDSRDIIADYASRPNVRTLVNAVNSGSPFIQWNRGVHEASSDYVWIAESDDYADPRLLERLVARLDAYPAVGLAYAQSLLVDEEGTVTGNTRQYTDSLDAEHWKNDYINDGRRECGQYLSRGCTIHNVSAVLFRRSDLQSIGGVDESKEVCGDYLAYMKVLLRSDIAYVAEPLNHFRRHPTSVYVSRNGLVFAGQMYHTIMHLVEVAEVLETAASHSKAHIAASLFDWWVRYSCIAQRSELLALEGELRTAMACLNWRPDGGTLAGSYSELLFARYRLGDLDLVRKYFPTALWNNPKLALNRGIWSIAAQAFLGLQRAR